MANEQHMVILEAGADSWNAWRDSNMEVPDLSGADLNGTAIVGYNLKKTNLSGVRLSGAGLSTSTLRWANLHGATMRSAALHRSDLSGTNLYKADLSHSNLTEANLMQARMVQTDLNHAVLTGASVFGVATWNVNLEGAIQRDLRITDEGEPIITIDNLEVAQFIYLLLNNANLRSVIDTITSKVVLILGRFTPERKAVLDAFRDVLRHRDLLPVLFDFSGPASRDLTETVSTLAVPVQPVIEENERPWAMFPDFVKYPWVLSTKTYRKDEDVAAFLEGEVFDAVTEKIREIKGRRQQEN